MGFAADIKKFAKKTGNGAEETTLATLFKMNELIIKRTAVDTGRARGGWIASVDTFASGKGRKDKDGGAAISRANSVAAQALGKVYTLVNNVKHIVPLEFGGYPDPPERGTYEKRTKQYEKRSKGGFSKQAPRGMVRVTVLEMKAYMRKQVRDLR